MRKELKKKLDNVGARFFGLEEYHSEPDFRKFIYTVADIVLKDTSMRLEKLEKLEKVIYKKYKHYSKIAGEYIEVSKNYQHKCVDKCESPVAQIAILKSKKAEDVTRDYLLLNTEKLLKQFKNYFTN